MYSCIRKYGQNGFMKLCAVDPHVHFYKGFSVDRAIQSSWRNVKANCKERPAGQCWCLASPPGLSGLELLKAEIYKQRSNVQFSESQDVDGLTFGILESIEGLIAVVAGTQAISAEGLEVLSLGVELPESAPKPLVHLIEDVKNSGGLPVVPWGAGKWLGNRGKLVSELEQRSGEGDGWLFADNGNRPWWWPFPRQLKRAASRDMAVITGSDPLPITGDEARIASAGILCPVSSIKAPWQDIKQNLLDNQLSKDAIFGAPMTNFRFWKNQIRLRTRALQQ